MIMTTKKFNISILSEKATFDIFKHFGFQSGKNVDKFDGYPADTGKNGVPYIKKGTNGFLSGDVISSVDLGTHTLFLANVTDGENLSNDNSVTYDYYQKHIKEAPQKKSKGWVCRICGYIYENENLPPDFICPICKHGAADFEKL